MERLNVTLDERHALKLAQMAERMHVQPGTLARSMLSAALDDVEPDARNIVELLDGLPGALAQANLGLEQARTGKSIPLDEL